MELTTALELDGKPIDDEEQDEDENPLAKDDDDIQDIPSCRNYKV